MPIANEKASNGVHPKTGKTPLDVVPEQLVNWNKAKQRVNEKIGDRRTAAGFWIKNQNPVGRAELKLEGAVDFFGFDFRDAIVMDIGASTGGFTELALECGAQQVIAIEKGTNQMKEPLRSNPKVDLHEKTDIFTVKAELAEPVDVFLIDVSFTSIRPVLTYIKDELVAKGEAQGNKRFSLQTQDVARMGEHKPLQAKGIDIIAMLKPQFETKPQNLVRGVVKNEKIRRQIAKDFEEWVRRKGFVIINKHDSDLPGKRGNIERFYWLRIAKG